MFLLKNKTDNRFRAGWRILGDQLLLILFLMLFGDFATTLIKSSLTSNGMLIMDAITGILAFGLSVWQAGRWLDHRPFVDFGFHLSRNWWVQFGFGAALGALLMGIIFLVELILGYVQVVQVGYTVVPGASLIWALLVMFIHYIGVSFSEEIWARGYILRNLLEGFSVTNRKVTIVLALLVSSFIFALPHAGNPGATPASTLILIVFGALCASGVLLTDELAIPLGLHLTWNFFQGHVFGFSVSGWQMNGGTILKIQQGGPAWFTGGSFGPEAGVVGLSAMVLGILLIILWGRRNFLAG
jgi:uncharacterized protein